MNSSVAIRILCAVSLVLGTGTLTPAYAQANNYPDKPIKLIVPYPPGGTTDVLARILSKYLWQKWSRSAIVENYGGAGGNIGATMVYHAPPDGYTLMFASPGPFAINKNLYASVGYDPAKFVSVSVVGRVPNVLVINPKKQHFSTLPELVAFAKANPGKLTYASQGNGSTSHLTAELLKSDAGVQITHVPYRGSAPAIAGLLAGECDMMFVELSSVLPYIQAGTLLPLAVGSIQRSPLLPKVPTVAETYKGFESNTWFAIDAPPGTPPAIADKLSAAVAEALKQPDILKAVNNLTVDPVGSNPAQMTTYVQQETQRWGSVIKQTGTKIQ
jgi:tripartite-type tricarboxylate transporter receptor subunit TctC